jgi:hypothetical protein
VNFMVTGYVPPGDNKKTYLWESSTPMGSTVSLQNMCWWTTKKMCTSGGGHSNHSEMPLITIWRSLSVIPHSCKNLAEWILLANHVWRHQELYPEMCIMSEAWKYQHKRCHATHQQSLDRALWCLRNQLYGTIFEIKELWVYIGGSWLCIQVGRSHAMQDISRRCLQK